MRYQGRGKRQLVKLQKRGRKGEESRIFFARGQGEEEEEKETLPTSSLFLFFFIFNHRKKEEREEEWKGEKKEKEAGCFRFFFLERQTADVLFPKRMHAALRTIDAT